ncbi:MAG: TolB family protein [Thiohalomonadales bacterium]
MKNNLAKTLLFVIVITSVVACGSDSANDTNIDTTGSNKTQSKRLTGSILVLGYDWLWKMDMATGSFAKVQGTHWKTSGDYHNVANFLLSPIAYEGDEFILSVQNCLPSDTFTSCIVTLDEKAIKITQFVLSGKIYDAAKMSRDRQYVAFTIQYGGSITNDTYLEIYDRSGNLISDDRISTNLARLSIDWLPDGRLVYSVRSEENRSIYFTSPYSTIVERNLTLPINIPGSIDKIAASADGKRIAFSLVSSSSFAATRATPWVTKIDGTNLHQLAVDPHADGTESSYINNPKWSPDGRWILVKYGGATGGSISNPGVLGYLFAVPSDGVKVPLSPYDDSIETTAIQIKSDWYTVFYDRGETTFNEDRWPNLDYDWIP